MIALKKERVTLIAFLAVALLSGQEVITVSGNVSDKINHSVGAVTVSYLCDGLEVIPAVQTDSSGYFEFSFNPLSIDENPFPNTINLGANYPNPFNPGTVIPLTTDKGGQFFIYDLLGREVQSLSIPEAGQYNIRWGGLLKGGLPAPAGVYFYSFQTEETRLTGKMILMDGGGNGGLSLSTPSGSRQQRATRSMECGGYTLVFSGDHIEDVTLDLGENGYTENTNLDQQVNRWPYWLLDLPDAYLPAGDTLVLNLNEYVYDDGQGLYQVSNTEDFAIVQDTLLIGVAASGVIHTEVIVVDDEGGSFHLSDSIQIQGDHTHIFFVADGDPEGIYVLDPYTMTYVDSLIVPDSIYRYWIMIVNEAGDTWYALKRQESGESDEWSLVWIDVETKAEIQSIPLPSGSYWLDQSYDGSKLITYDFPPRTFSIYDSETGAFLGGQDTLLNVRRVRASKTENTVYVWGELRDTGVHRMGAWDMEASAWLWVLPYDSDYNMGYYSGYSDMAVSYDGEHVFFRGSDSFGNSKFWDIDAQTGAVISEHYTAGLNQLAPTQDNQYVYLTANPGIFLLEVSGIARYDIENHTMETVFLSLNDLGFECGDYGAFVSIVISVLPDNRTGIVFGSAYCPDDPTWDSHDNIIKIDLDSVEFLEGIHMPTTTMPGYITQSVFGPLVPGNYPY